MIGTVTALSGREGGASAALAAASALGVASGGAASARAAAAAASGDVAGSAEVAASAVAAARPNPVASVAPNLGITVLTFHSASGAVVATAPTRAQLDAYLLHGDPAQDPATIAAASAGGSAGGGAGFAGVGLVA